MKIKLLSLFSGIGAFEKALDECGIPYDLINYCEIDKYASRSYSAIHGVPEAKNLWDVTKVDETALPKDIDLLTYGFPCQDISSSGKMRGMFNEDHTLTRSGLFFEALRIIREAQPKVAIAENVKNLVGKKFKDQFQLVLDSLNTAGYNNYWQVLNAKDYGIPQNRERVFIVSIRKDIDNKEFRFPQGFPLKLRLKHMLESNVDEKYYLSEAMLKYIVAKKDKPYGYEVTINDPEGILANPIRASGDRPVVAECIQVADLNHYGNDQMNHVYSAEGIAPTLTTKTGGGREVKIQEPPDANCGGGQNLKRIRKLTPKECFRLMGFKDEDFNKAQQINSNTQLYKQAGNSIVVDVLTYIYKALETAFMGDKQPELDVTKNGQYTLF